MGINHGYNNHIMFLPEAIVKCEFLVAVEDGGVQAVFAVQEEKCPTDAEPKNVHIPVLMRSNERLSWPHRLSRRLQLLVLRSLQIRLALRIPNLQHLLPSDFSEIRSHIKCDRDSI